MSGPDESVEQREARVGRNEGVIRAVNDQIEELNRAFAVSDEELAIVCECGELECVEQIQIARPAYARVRADHTLFLVISGHEDPTVEAVVESGQSGHVVVQKYPGKPAEIAANMARVRRDPQERARRYAINSIATHMNEYDMSSEDDFEDVRHSMLPEDSTDFLASGLLSITWRDVRKRLDEIS